MAKTSARPAPTVTAVIGPVLADSGPLLALFNAAALDFLRWAEGGGIKVDTPQLTSLTEILRIKERFADLPFDLADASIADAAARLRGRQVLTLDPDFDVYRDKRGKALVNVMRGPKGD